MPTAPPPCSPARSSWGRGSSRRSRRSPPRNSTCRCAREHDFRRYRPHAERRHDCRQSQSIENSGTALRLAAAEVRAILIEQASARLEMSADSLSVADGVISAANGKTVSYGELAASVDLQARGDRDRAAEAGRNAQDRRPVDRALRYSRESHRQGGLRAGPAPARHGARPRRASAELRRDAARPSTTPRRRRSRA